jgi:hypothetical protein
MRVSGAAGGCLCGAVRFTYDGELSGALGQTTVCVCGQCRKAQGFAAAVVPAEAKGLTLTAGADQVREFQSSPGKHRAFCGLCGSPLYSRLDARPASLRLRLGALDAPPEELRIEAIIHAASAPAWIDIADAPRYPEVEPGRPA